MGFCQPNPNLRGWPPACALYQRAQQVHQNASAHPRRHASVGAVHSASGTRLQTMNWQNVVQGGLPAALRAWRTVAPAPRNVLRAAQVEVDGVAVRLRQARRRQQRVRIVCTELHK